MPELVVSNLQKSFDGTSVLRGVSFTLERGQVLAIIGSSGSGKTTLLRCLNFLETPDSGSMKLDGQELLTADERQLRRNRLRFGLVFQSFNLFPQYTALENVTLAPKLLGQGTGQELDERGRALLAQVGLSDKCGAYPYQLSGGQQQRTAIARALALQPEVLCFDEPTSALDPELTGEVLRVIRELKDGSRTMIVVTHEMGFARQVADRVLFMADGVVAEYAPPEEFFTNPKTEKARAFLRSAEEF